MPKILKCLLNIPERKMNFSLLFLSFSGAPGLHFLHNKRTKTISKKLKVEFVRDTPKAVQLRIKKAHVSVAE